MLKYNILKWIPDKKGSFKYCYGHPLGGGWVWIPLEEVVPLIT